MTHKKRQIIEEIASLREENIYFCESIQRLHCNRDFYALYYEHWRGQYTLFDELPLEYASTVFFTRKDELRKHVIYSENINDISYYSSVKLAAYCERAVATSEGTALYFRSPYSQFKSLPIKNLDIDYAQSEIQGSVVYVYLSRRISIRDGKARADYMSKHVDECSKYCYTDENVADNVWIPRGTYLIYFIQFSGLGLVGKKNEQADKVESTFIRYALRYCSVNTEENAVKAFNDIANYCRLYYSDHCHAERFSPLNLCISSRNGRRVHFFYKNNQIWIKEQKREPNFNYWEYHDYLRRGTIHRKTIFDDCNPDEKKAYTLQAKYYNNPVLKQCGVCFPSEEDIADDEAYRHMNLEEYGNYLRKNDCEYFNYDSGDIVVKEWEDREQRRKEFCDGTSPYLIHSYVALNDTMPKKLDKLSMKCLKKERSLLLRGNEIIRKRFAKTEAYYLNEIKHFSDYRLGWFPWFCDWSNFKSWENTFFDFGHDVINGELEVFIGCSTSGEPKDKMKKVTPLTIAQHKYAMKFANLYEGEDIRKFQQHSILYRDLNADYVRSVLGYCDTVNIREQGVDVHIVDPTGNVVLNKLDIPVDVAMAASGHICVVSFAYNYFKAEPTLVEFQLLPYSLTNKLGEYSTGTFHYKNKKYIHIEEEMVLNDFEEGEQDDE